jgi:hypothetical protein
MLPLARLVQQLKQAKEDSHEEQTTSTSHSMEQCFPSSADSSSIGFPRAASSNWHIWSPISWSRIRRAAQDKEQEHEY